MSKNCAVCLKMGLALMDNIEKGNLNIQYITKLAECVPEVDWNSNCFICQACADSLENAYQFRMLCLHSETVRRGMKTETVIDDTFADENTDPVICFHCNESFPDKTVLTQHIQERHVKKHDESYEIDGNNENDNSDLDTSVRISPKRSYKKRPTQTEFKCDHCNETFKSSKQLVMHASGLHEVDAKNMKPYKCDVCDSRFANSSNLMQHKKYHEGKRCYMCSFCGKGFITTSDLTVHEKQHLNKREYKCDNCPKHFNTHKDLRSHKLVVHTDHNLWAHLCEICNRRFPIKSNFLQHMRRHTGEKRFACHICEKRFTDKCVLQKHFRSHTNVRAYKCEHCSKEYKDNQFLDIHLTKVHGIGNAKIPNRVRKHVCGVCSKSFFAKNKLTRHMYTHSGERPYGCEVCDKRFTDKSYVKQHLKKAHNIEVYKENDNV